MTSTEQSQIVIGTWTVTAGAYDDTELVATVHGTRHDAQLAADRWNLDHLATIAHRAGAGYARVDPEPIATELPREVHPAGMHAETVTYALPYSGRAVYRMIDTTGAAERFTISGGLGVDLVKGSRDECLAWCDATAQRLAEREGRRRAGSSDPADHPQPAGGGTPTALLTLERGYAAWCRAVPGRSARFMPDESRQLAQASNAIASAYAMWQRTWARGAERIEADEREAQR